MALIIVGLAPSFPLLRRFEDWMRSAAHRLAGIPTRVIGAGEELRHSDLAISTASSDSVPADTLLIPRGDWERMGFYRSSADGHLTAPEDFRRDMEVIFALSAWILDRKLKLAQAGGRERFSQIEEELRKRRDTLILALDERSGYRPGETRRADAAGETLPEDDAGGELSEIQRASWERLAGDADDLADDLCILLALYVEHEIIATDELEMMVGSKAHGLIRQQELAMRKLDGFLGNLLGEQASTSYLRSHAVLVWLWTLCVVIAIAVLWSLLPPGRFETAMQRGDAGDPYWRILNYAFTAFNSYCIPMLVALALHDGAQHAHRWRNMWRAHWTTRLPQALSVIFASWVVATLFIVGLALWQAALAQGGFASSEQDVWSTLRLSFEYNAPTPLRGAVLALVVVVLLDAWTVRPWPHSRRAINLTSLGWAIGAAIIMAVAGGLTRTLSSWSWVVHAGRPGLDVIDRGLIVYAMIHAGLIGFFVVFCVAEALVNHRRSNNRSRAKKPPAAGDSRKPAPVE
jgi:hypothetical protein